jgi:hypothetical protein
VFQKAWKNPPRKSNRINSRISRSGCVKRCGL